MCIPHLLSTLTPPAGPSFREGDGGELSLLEPCGGTKRDLVLRRHGRVSLQPRGAAHQREKAPGQGRQGHLRIWKDG